MKKYSHFLFVLLLLGLLCSFNNVTDEELISKGAKQETLDLLKYDSIQGQMGKINLPECHAALTVPDGFVFIDAKQTKKLLVDYWGNPTNRTDKVVGALVPNTVSYFYQIGAAFIVSYENMGYVKDDDANSIDYDELLKGMKRSTEEENKKLPVSQQLTLKGWAVTPHYIQEKHVLIWARLFTSNKEDIINYDMRILGKDGLVSINAVVDPEYLHEAENYGNTMIGSLSYNEGYAYSDFDPKRDHVSEWTIGGLVAGSILAKSGVLAKLGIFLLKFWKLLALAFLGVVAGIAKLFKRKEHQQQITSPSDDRLLS